MNDPSIFTAVERTGSAVDSTVTSSTLRARGGPLLDSDIELNGPVVAGNSALLR